MTVASTSPQYIWAPGSGGVSYVDISNGEFRALASIATPDTKDIPAAALDELLARQLTNVAQIEKALRGVSLDSTRIASSVPLFVDSDNTFYAANADGKLFAYRLADPAKPEARLKILRTLDFTGTLKRNAEYGSAEPQKYGARIVGVSVAYDGKLIILTNRSVHALDRSFEGDLQTVEFGADDYIFNSMAIDEKGGIYIASDGIMRKVVWTGSKLSADEADGAWSSPYDVGREPPTVKFGKGTGSTPTLMGFGDDRDKLVVITDGADRTKVVAFWRDEIPSDFKQQGEAKSPRIAGQIQITCGLDPQPEFIQSEQSCVANGYGVFVVNNIPAPGRNVDVVAGGPVVDPPAGCERVEWNPQARQWTSAWTRGDVVGTGMVPSVSSVSNIAFVTGYTKDGWEFTGMDWNTGEIVHRTIFAQENLGVGACAIIQMLENGDLLFNSIGVARVKPDCIRIACRLPANG